MLSVDFLRFLYCSRISLPYSRARNTQNLADFSMRKSAPMVQIKYFLFFVVETFQLIEITISVAWHNCLNNFVRVHLVPCSLASLDLGQILDSVETTCHQPQRGMFYVTEVFVRVKQTDKYSLYSIFGIASAIARRQYTYQSRVVSVVEFFCVVVLVDFLQYFVKFTRFHLLCFQQNFLFSCKNLGKINNVSRHKWFKTLFDTILAFGYNFYYEIVYHKRENYSSVFYRNTAFLLC